MSKGSRPRPLAVSREQYSANYDVIFGKKKLDRNPCGCGRSPTGFCTGWHALSEAEYQQRLAAFMSKRG